MIDPEEGTYHLSSRPTTVLLPLPLAPTNAVVLPAGIERLKSRSTEAPGREGYAKHRFEISILPSQPCLGIFPVSSRGSSSDSLSMTLKSSDAAAAALVNAVIWGANVETDVAAISAAKTTLRRSFSIYFCTKACAYVKTWPAFATSPLWNIRNPCQKLRAIPQ